MEVTRQAFYDYLSHKNTPWKYQTLADEMMKIHEEDQYNDC
ncbi:IS3 family transposase, partial [Ruminococcus sp. TF12-2]